tara:strand:- start:521 stop:820 length:300 start_codon:yes stop_codon:yes gene_type:complete
MYLGENMNLSLLVRSLSLIVVWFFLVAVVLDDSLDFQVFKLKRELERVEYNIEELKHQLTYVIDEHKKKVNIELMERIIYREELKNTIKDLESSIKTLE